MWLIVSVCLAAGPVCHPLYPSKEAMASWEECNQAGAAFEKAWLARHTDYHEGGVTCSSARPKDMPR